MRDAAAAEAAARLAEADAIDAVKIIRIKIRRRPFISAS